MQFAKSAVLAADQSDEDVVLRRSVLEGRLGEEIAADSLATLRAQVSELESEMLLHAQSLEESSDGGLISWFRAAIDELGFGFGWAPAISFTSDDPDAIQNAYVTPIPEVNKKHCGDGDWDRHRTTDFDQAFLSGETRHLVDRDRDRGDAYGVSLTLSWDLGDIAYEPESIDVSRETREVIELRDDVLRVPDCFEPFSPILVAAPLQLFAYYIAVGLGRDVDQPRNLAKSVTVE